MHAKYAFANPPLHFMGTYYANDPTNNINRLSGIKVILQCCMRELTSFSSAFSLNTALAVRAFGKPILAIIVTYALSLVERVEKGSGNQLFSCFNMLCFVAGFFHEGLAFLIDGRGSDRLIFFSSFDCCFYRKNKYL